MTLSGISPLQESLREGIGGALPAGRQGILPLGKRTAGPYRRLSWGWADLQWVEGKESGGGANKGVLTFSFKKMHCY